MVKHTISLESREVCVELYLFTYVGVFRWQSNHKAQSFVSQVKGKYLVIKFVFDIYNDGGGLVCNSLDKYLPTHAWSKIYEKLNKSIEQYVEKDMQRPSKKMIKIHSFQLQLSCSWADFNEMYRSLLGDDTSGGTVDQSADRIFYPYILTVKVHQLSRIDEFDKNRSKAELLAKDRAESKEIDDAPQSTTATSSGIQVGKCEPSSPTSRKRHHEEYVPSATTVSPKHSKLTYTPSKSVEAKADEYTPCEFVSADATTAEAIGYRYYPSPINNNNRNEYPLNTSKPYSRGQIKSPRPNRTRSKLSMIDAIEASEPSAVDKSSTKANLSPDLFGESPNTADEVNSPTEASVELPISPRKRSKRRAKVITQRTIDSFTIPKTASSSSSSTSLSSSSKTSTSSAKVSSTARCSPLHKRSKSTVDRKTNKNDDDASKREEEELQTIHEKIRRKIESNTLTDHRGNQIGLTRLM